QLNSTASYQAHDLTGIGLYGDLSGWNFAGQNLTKASFGGNLTGANLSAANLANANLTSTLKGADFSDANVREARFDNYYGSGEISLAQLYSTASYKAGDLSGISLRFHDLTGGNFPRQNFRNADFFDSTLTGANFREANLANANFF